MISTRKITILHKKMKNSFFILFSFFAFGAFGQAAKDYAVETWATVSSNPAKIVVHWVAASDANNYQVYRKDKDAQSWGAPVASLGANALMFEDNDVSVGVSYEYQVHKLGTANAYGYVNAGIEIAPVHTRGNFLLLVDSVMSDDLFVEIDFLVKDLIGDGWYVIKKEVSNLAPVSDIKQIIQTIHSTQPLTAIYCLGHVPVPYSGNTNPDGHSNHKGAWPADGYYGELDGNWTDQTVDNVSASDVRNQNIPNDGKFDQSYFSTDVELQVGRVDFDNMPAFSLSAKELLRQYLNKSHAFKNGEMDVQMKAIIDDNFGAFNGEAFAASGWKNFAPLLHPDKVSAEDYRIAMDTASYIWSYGCGGGSYSSCNGVGNTGQFAGDSLQGIFSCLFGSYFGDWDSKNNLLRATLAQGTMLTNCWSGRPYWQFHHMGLGENIGYSTKISMNSSSTLYPPGSFGKRSVTMGLMGDPSLRMHMMVPPNGVGITFDGNNMLLHWTINSNVNTFYVYRADEFDGPYELLTESPIVGTSYTDECMDANGAYYYMVRATTLEETPSGSYHNLSIGRFASSAIAIQPIVAQFNISTSSNSITLSNTSTGASNWLWDFGDGTTSTMFAPNHTYSLPGTYTITLIAYDECKSDTTMSTVMLDFTGTDDFVQKYGLTLSPNPAGDYVVVSAKKLLGNATIRVFDAYAKMVLETNWKTNEAQFLIPIDHLPMGIYYVQIQTSERVGGLKLIKK